MAQRKKTAARLTGGIRPDRAHLWRTENVGRLLLHCFRVHENRLIARIHAAGFPELRRAYFNVLRHIDFDGTQLIELARRANITKAAMGQLVASCERLKLVRIDAHPDDGRAKLVRFTPRGTKLMNKIEGVMAELEHEFAAVLGEEQYEEFRAMLKTLQRDL